MGKKRRMLAKPQKFASKFASHPRMVALSNQEQIEKLPPVVEEIATPVLEDVAVELQPAPEPEPEPKKVAPKAVTASKRRATTKRKTATSKAKKTTSKK